MASGHERWGMMRKSGCWFSAKIMFEQQDGFKKMPGGVWSFALIDRSLIRALVVSATLAAGSLLAGCDAMTDEQIAEIYSLGRESFFGGQESFQFQAYPFRMTPLNMAKHRNNPNMAFWKMIKEGYDHFEITHQEPKVDFCEKKYVFDAVKPPGATRDLVFDAAAKCPAYVIPDEIADATRQKQEEDQAETAKMIAKGTPVAKLNTGIDG